MKYEWKKQDKELYLPKAQPVSIVIPAMKFFTLNGRGNPNSSGFTESIQVLYSLAYAIKMMPKQGMTPEGYFDYTVYPLEGIWDLTEEGKQKDFLDKNELIFTLMIRQPDFVSEGLAQSAIELTQKKKPHPLLESVKFSSIEDGHCVQMLHKGSFDDEPASFGLMVEYCAKNNLKRKSKVHREIYLSDARKTTPEKLNTVLRIGVEKVTIE